MTAFRCIGGSLLWRTVPLSEDDAKHLLAVFHDEWASSIRCGDEDGSTKAATLHCELYLASAKAKDWARAGGMAR